MPKPERSIHCQGYPQRCQSRWKQHPPDLRPLAQRLPECPCLLRERWERLTSQEEQKGSQNGERGEFDQRSQGQHRDDRQIATGTKQRPTFLSAYSQEKSQQHKGHHKSIVMPTQAAFNQSQRVPSVEQQ